MNKINLEKLPFEYRVLRLLMASGKTLIMHLEEALQEVNLSGPKMWALTELAEAEQPLGISQLAKCMHVGKSNVTQMVDRLEAEELARRIPNPEDRRSVLVELTPLGYERYEEGRAIQKRITSKVIEGVPQAHLEQLEIHLEAFLEHIQQITPCHQENKD